MRTNLQFFIIIYCLAIFLPGASLCNPSIQDDSTKINKTICYFEANVNPRLVNIDDVEKSIQYPLYSKQNGSESEGTVTLLVGSDGSVIEVISYSGSADFKEEVLRKIMMIRFTPAISRGKPVQSMVTVPFRFKLE